MENILKYEYDKQILHRKFFSNITFTELSVENVVHFHPLCPFPLCPQTSTFHKFYYLNNKTPEKKAVKFPDKEENAETEIKILNVPNIGSGSSEHEIATEHGSGNLSQNLSQNFEIHHDESSAEDKIRENMQQYLEYQNELDNYEEQYLKYQNQLDNDVDEDYEASEDTNDTSDESLMKTATDYSSKESSNYESSNSYYASPKTTTENVSSAQNDVKSGSSTYEYTTTTSSTYTSSSKAVIP